jgi:hypothetical protein
MENGRGEPIASNKKKKGERKRAVRQKLRGVKGNRHRYTNVRGHHDRTCNDRTTKLAVKILHGTLFSLAWQFSSPVRRKSVTCIVVINRLA